MNNRSLVSGGVALLVVLVAGAVFVTAGMLGGPGVQLPDGRLIGFGFGGASGGGCGDVSRVRAAELPGLPLTRRAVLVGRQGDSLFMGVPLRDVKTSAGGAAAETTGFDGPVQEVVVNHATKIYQDVTFRDDGGGCGQVKQVLEPGSMEDIVDGTTFLVWGEQKGTRVLASYLVYELPPVSKSWAGR
jgi:hypothetical protein